VRAWLSHRSAARGCRPQRRHSAASGPVHIRHHVLESGVLRARPTSRRGRCGAPCIVAVLRTCASWTSGMIPGALRPRALATSFNGGDRPARARDVGGELRRHAREQAAACLAAEQRSARAVEVHVLPRPGRLSPRACRDVKIEERPGARAYGVGGSDEPCARDVENLEFQRAASCPRGGARPCCPATSGQLCSRASSPGPLLLWPGARSVERPRQGVPLQLQLRAGRRCLDGAAEEPVASSRTSRSRGFWSSDSCRR
jgi:hypothetical protein